MTDAVTRATSAYAYPLTIGEILGTGVRRAPDQSIVYGDRRFTYRELEDRVVRLASALASLGVRHGHTVGVMDWDTNRYLECFFAIPMMGAVLHTINVRLSPEQVLYTINHAPDDVILVNAEFLPLLLEIWDRVVPGKLLVLMSDDDSKPAAGALPIAGQYEALLAAADPGYAFPAIDENARATTFYTTGTTGLPKGVYFTHRQLVLHTLAVINARSGTTRGSFNDDDVYMPITPMFHVHAWGMPYAATMRGSKQVYPGRYVPDTLVGLIDREKVSFSHCVPTILEMMLAAARRRSVDLSGWKVVIGGAALPQAVAAQAVDAGVEVFAGYGMSETCPVLTISRLMPEMETWDRDRQIEVRCRAGRPISLVQIRTVDDAMNDASPGEIVVRAPWLTQGYLHDQVASEKLWAGGWLHTGDIGVLGPDGYLKITDRLKDVIKTGGEWVSSVDLEDMLRQMPQIAEAAVIGVPDPKWSERPLAIVVPRESDVVEPEAVRSHLMGFVSRGLLSKYGVPERIVVIDEIPKTSVGKFDKKLLRQRYGA